MARAGHFAFLMVAVACLAPVKALAQGETTSAIVGQVRDTTNAVVPGAIVTITNPETGLRRSAKTDDAGRFNFPQLKPGTYSVKVEASGFEPRQNNNVVSALGQKQTVDFTLGVARSNETVEVSSEAPILNPENANTSTTLNAPALEDLPNPGGDLTYPLQFAPGALINTAGSGNDFVGGTNGYGNVEFNGLPALSNGYIVDGLETNDPLTNLNSGLSTNLVLGLNSISEVTVNTLSYSVDQGRYGASQVNYVTKSGSNQFHGNLYELWNGARLNAADYFTECDAGKSQARSDGKSLWGQSGRADCARQALLFLRQRMGSDRAAHRHADDGSQRGVPTICAAATSSGRNRLRNRINLSAVAAISRVLPEDVLPVRKHQRYASRCARVSSELGRHFGLRAIHRMETVARTGKACRTPAMTTNRYRRSASTTTSIEKDTTWFRFQADTGVQAAYTDPINSLFDAVSPQPLYSFAAGYTHVFSQNLVNYFNPAFSWYESLFGPSHLAEDARGISDCVARQWRECAVHHDWRTRQHLGARQASLSCLHQ